MAHAASGTSGPTESPNLLPGLAVCVVVSNDGTAPILVTFKSKTDSDPISRQLMENEVIRVTTFDHSMGILSVTVTSSQSVPYRFWWSQNEVIEPDLTECQAFLGFLMVLWPVAIVDEPYLPCRRRAHRPCGPCQP